MDLLRALLEWVVSLIGPLVAPDWAALIRLIPIGVLLLVAGFYGWVLLRYRRAGTRRVGHPPRAPRAPAGIHLPGPSLAPFLISAAAAALFFSAALGGIALLVAALFLVFALIAWGREAVHEYDALGGARSQALITAADAANSTELLTPTGPPEGVHLPPPSLLPFLVSLGAAVMLFGAAIGLSFVLLGALMTVLALIGWLIDSGREYRAVAEADATGHLVSPAPKRAPQFVIALMSLLFVVVGGAQAGFFASSDVSPSPSPSGSTCVADATGVLTVCAELVVFSVPTIEIAAGAPSKIRFVNYDAGVPHNIAIYEGGTDASGTQIFNGEIFAGVDERTYDIPALNAGATYAFICIVHPNMVGTVVAQ
jgi:plastocyanin